jgi:hypothetical protein
MTETLSLLELREKWSQAWGKQAHKRISRQMLERSLDFKARQRSGHGLNAKEQQRLNTLVKSYKRNPNMFNQGYMILKPGVKLIRTWKGKTYSVTVTSSGFYYGDKEYSSLSAIANKITGAKWNGWLFFGLNNKKAAT